MRETFNGVRFYVANVELGYRCCLARMQLLYLKELNVCFDYSYLFVRYTRCCVKSILLMFIHFTDCITMICWFICLARVSIFTKRISIVMFGSDFTVFVKTFLELKII